MIPKSNSKKLMVIGAHPDDCELTSGGFAALCAKKGWIIRFVSVTNGDAGHQTLKPKALAKRRLSEGRKAAGRIGASYETLGEPDGRLFVTDKSTRKVVGAIRKFRPDVLITPRACDYHRDHRATAQLVLDASFILGVPLIYPEGPYCPVPVILYACDVFTEGPPFYPHLLVDINQVMPTHLQMLADHESQFFEWLPWVSRVAAGNSLDRKIDLKKLVKNRRKTLLELGGIRPLETAKRFAKGLKKKYGRTVKAALAFQVSEYGRPATAEELRRLFPF